MTNVGIRLGEPSPTGGPQGQLMQGYFVHELNLKAHAFFEDELESPWKCTVSAVLRWPVRGPNGAVRREPNVPRTRGERPCRNCTTDMVMRVLVLVVRPLQTCEQGSSGECAVSGRTSHVPAHAPLTSVPPLVRGSRPVFVGVRRVHAALRVPAGRAGVHPGVRRPPGAALQGPGLRRRSGERAGAAAALAA
jgi:hypothetical protein